MTQDATIRNFLRANLLQQGKTISSWARERGLAVSFVTKIISRFAGTEKRPSRGQSLEIIEALEAETGIKICG